LPKYIVWLVAVALSYALLHYIALRAIYYPMRFPQGLWDAQREIGARDVWLEASDGVRLHGWWIPKSGARFVTLYLHGNAGNITHRAWTAAEITAAGSALFLLDYRGYGKSRGAPSEKGLYADADAAYDYLIAHGYQPSQIVLQGESLGTAVAVDLAARRACSGLILEAPFTSARAVAGRVLPLAGPLLVWGFDSKSKIPRIRAPLLVMHGDRDPVINFDLGRQLFAAAPEPKTFWTVAGAGHGVGAAAGIEYRKHLEEFYNQLPPR
jgi:pimeloyl-ACP methyl ester carboxylesterase